MLFEHLIAYSRVKILIILLMSSPTFLQMPPSLVRISINSSYSEINTEQKTFFSSQYWVESLLAFLCAKLLQACLL